MPGGPVCARPIRGRPASLVARARAMAGLCTIAGGPAAAGSWTPALGLATRFDDRRSPGGVPVRLTTAIVAPQLGYETGAGRSGIRFMARRTLEFERGLPRAAGPVYRDPNFTRRLVIGAQDTLNRATVLGLEAGPSTFEGRKRNSSEHRAGWFGACAPG